MSVFCLYLVVKACVLIVLGVIVLYSQIKSRPNHVAFYYTNDPDDNQRGGVLHTCGCELPSTVQKEPQMPMNSTDNALNVCYDKSSLQNAVHVLMYNVKSAAAEVLEPMIKQEKSQTVNKSGYLVTQEAHELSGNITENLDVELPNLYLNGYKPHDVIRTIPYLQSDQFTSFPSSFLRLGFIYVCNECSTSQNCSLSMVNELLKNVARGEPWGYCYEWGGPSCSSYSSRYIAKCTLFPPVALPFNFALQKFLKQFFQLPKIGSIYFLPKYPIPASGILNTEKDSVSFQPSVPYVNVSTVVADNITLKFVILQKSSALWFNILELFPTLEKDCSSLPKVEICNGTSFCNVLTAGGKANLPAAVIRNDDTFMRNSTSCNERLASDVSFDNGYPSWGYNDPETICMERSCSNRAPYLVTWNISQDENVLNDSLNQFLYSTILKDFWAQRSGVCTNNYYGVFQHFPLSPDNASNSDDESLQNSRFFEVNCTKQGNIFCWLTGKYNYLNDPPIPGKGKFTRDMDGEENRGPANRFVCYRNTKQPFWIWMASTLGILFGWMGTVTMLFQFAEWLVSRIRKRRRQHHASGPPRPAASSARITRTTRPTRKIRIACIANPRGWKRISQASNS